MPATLAHQLSDADNQGIRLTSASLAEPATPPQKPLPAARRSS